MRTDEAAFVFGFMVAALLRVWPRCSSVWYRSFIGLRWDMGYCSLLIASNLAGPSKSARGVEVPGIVVKALRSVLLHVSEAWSGKAGRLNASQRREVPVAVRQTERKFYP